MVYLQILDGLIELVHGADAPADEEFGITHIAFVTGDLDGDYQEILDAGYEGLVEAKIAGTVVGQLAFVRDPNGARVELLQRDVKMRGGVVDQPIIKSFDHCSLIAHGFQGGPDFYNERLGMKNLKSISVPATELEITYFNYDYDVLEPRT